MGQDPVDAIKSNGMRREYLRLRYPEYVAIDPASEIRTAAEDAER